MMALRRRILVRLAPLGLILGLWAPGAAADPMLTVVPDGIDPVGAEVSLSIRVDPADTPLSSFVLNFSTIPSGIELLGLSTAFSGSLDPANGLASIAGVFGTDQADSFEAGILRVRGLAIGTTLQLDESSSYVDAAFNDIPAGGPRAVATVVPEPATAALYGLGLAGLALFARRSRSAALHFLGAEHPRPSGPNQSLIDSVTA